MTTDQPKAHAGVYRVRRATITNRDLCGLTLGDLRRLMDAAQGMPDDAKVRFEDLSKSYVYVDEWHAQRVNVQHEEKATDDDH